MADERMRVHRALALAGVASRRGAEALVAEGRVTVNGVTATVGQLVGPDDALAVDGRALRGPEPRRAYLLHKPRGVVSTAHDPQGRPTVLDELPDDVRLYPVGRLDIDTTGALIVTNDGELAARLMHPSSKAPKTYEVLLRGQVSAATVRRLRNGVELDDGMTLPARVEAMDRKAPGGTWLIIELTEGRNRQVRRMGEAVGHPVLRLHRSRYAGIGVSRLAPGRWRPLTRAEWRKLGAAVGLER
ncbi:pseudouridine synthase [Miltoncostaea marina]|uniref:pseudouridine synthase n=1 Tax=Miltoncostaea marina TaxID=2843215 RepID=UPI001C3D0859|nr:pseudouridine synthase [Miltoncostaea marina]